MLEQGEIITLDDNTEYVVVLPLEYRGNQYVYVSNYNNDDDTKICIVNNDNILEVKDELLLAELDEEIQKNIGNDEMA